MLSSRCLETDLYGVRVLYLSTVNCSGDIAFEHFIANISSLG